MMVDQPLQRARHPIACLTHDLVELGVPLSPVGDPKTKTVIIRRQVPERPPTASKPENTFGVVGALGELNVRR
jgi:hypothetical protein